MDYASDHKPVHAETFPSQDCYNHNVDEIEENLEESENKYNWQRSEDFSDLTLLLTPGKTMVGKLQIAASFAGCHYVYARGDDASMPTVVRSQV